MGEKINGELLVCGSSAEWDEFCQNSIQMTPFSQSWFINALSDESIKYFFYENKKIVAAVLVTIKNGREVQFDHSAYQSICFSKSINSLPDEDRHRQIYSTLNKIILIITKIHQEIYFSFHPSILDMRPLQWHNFHAKNLGTFSVDVRYTAHKSLLSFSNMDSLLATVKKNRKPDYLRSIKEGVTITSQFNVDIFLDLYRMTFERQGIFENTDRIDSTRRILEAMNENHGFMLTAWDRGGRPVSSVVILFGGETCYNIFSASNPSYRSLGANGLLMFEAMLKAKQFGIEKIDFVGVNSPQRAAFKLSFSAVLVPYFWAALGGGKR